VVVRADAAFASRRATRRWKERSERYAIPIRANENLERDIAELLSCLVGLPDFLLKVALGNPLYDAFLRAVTAFSTQSRTGR
jgi:hypothetical protein